MSSEAEIAPSIEREVYHRKVDGKNAIELISTGFHVGLPELRVSRRDVKQPEYSISYIIKGEGEFADSDGKVYRFRPGHVIQRYPNRNYSIHRDEAFEHAEFFIIIPKSIFRSFRDTGVIQEIKSVFDVGLDPVFLKKLDEFVYQFRTSNSRDIRILTMETIQILIDFFKRDRVRRQDSSDKRKIEKACLLLGQELGEKIQLEKIAEQVGMSYESFRKKFREYRGSSPTQYRTQKRFEHAAHLLIEDRVGIKEIAYDVGYADVGNFSKQFQKWIGQTPGQFRKLNRLRLDRNI